MYADEALRWRSRPLLAATLKGVAFALPIAASAGAVYGATHLLRPPTGSLSASVAWWIGISGGATAALLGAGRISRKLLPLAGLTRLSLVFPDGAPSRFEVAMRTGTPQTLEQRLASARSGWPDVAPADAARRLLELVALLDTHDRLTRGHSERVRAYAQAIGRQLGLDRRDLDRLNWAALLHDIGKLEVPAEILTKRGRPDAEEWEILRRHPELGDALIGPLREWLGEWSAAVVEHHERWDGHGYPHGLAGSDISLAGRIVAVADVFDVITSSRSYKEAFTPSAAREEITRGAGTQFDPDVVRALLGISVRGTRTTGTLAWLAQAPVLAKAALVPAAATVSAAAVGLSVSDSNRHVEARPAVPGGAAVGVRASSEPVGSIGRVVAAARPRVVARARPSAARSRPTHLEPARERVVRRTRAQPSPPIAPPPAASPAPAVPPAPEPSAPSEDKSRASTAPVAAKPPVTPSVPPTLPSLPLPPLLPSLPLPPLLPSLPTDSVTNALRSTPVDLPLPLP